jgi:hypothetical protein
MVAVVGRPLICDGRSKWSKFWWRRHITTHNDDQLEGTSETGSVSPTSCYLTEIGLPCYCREDISNYITSYRFLCVFIVATRNAQGHAYKDISKQNKTKRSSKT